MEKSASLTVKNIGKPCTGEPYARFDEGALGKKAYRKRSRPEPVLYSTRNSRVDEYRAGVGMKRSQLLANAAEQYLEKRV